MRRFARHAYTVLSALSLLLCVGACVLWVRSYRTLSEYAVEDRWEGEPYGIREYQLRSSWGQLGWSVWYVYGDESDGTVKRRSWFREEPADDYFWRGLRIGHDPESRVSYCLGFSWSNWLDSKDRTNIEPPRLLIYVPYWFLAVALAAPPAVKVITSAKRRRRTRRTRRGLCPACGYDLRATPERCPECGTVPPRKAVP